jgi:hypothetical protein
MLIGPEKTALFPKPIPFSFHLGWLVAFGKL